MKRMNLFLSVALFAFATVACDGRGEGSPVYVLPPAPDYSAGEAWYKDLKPAGKVAADVFYIAPTCIWNWTDGQGRTVFFGDIANRQQRESLRPSLELAADIFAQESDFYAPYYRQISLESWMEGEDTVAARFPYAMADVHEAFDYYMDHYNRRRPFILAGFSQGGKAVVELLKSLTEEESRRLVAAYVVGYRVTTEELAQHPTMVPAVGADDTGVVVCYNSVADTGSICPLLAPSAICINPVNWSTGTEPAALNDTVTVRVAPAAHVLLVEGLDAGKYYHPSLGSLFKPGNFHLQELTLYADRLRENVRKRIGQFGSGEQ